MEMKNINSRHEAGAELFTFMGTYAPAFGMMGTVMGLIVMMNGFDTGGTGPVADKFKDFKLKINDVDLHFLHIKSSFKNAKPLMLIHGWPGSIFEFLDIQLR